MVVAGCSVWREDDPVGNGYGAEDDCAHQGGVRTGAMRPHCVRAGDPLTTQGAGSRVRSSVHAVCGGSRVVLRLMTGIAGQSFELASVTRAAAERRQRRSRGME